MSRVAPVSTVVWLAVTFMTAPEPDATLDAFYLRVRPGGPGWAQVSERLGLGREKTPGGALAWTNWIAGVTAVYSTLFGIGKLIFGDLGTGSVRVVVAAMPSLARDFSLDSVLGMIWFSVASLLSTTFLIVSRSMAIDTA